MANSDGLYSFAGLDPGTYDVKAEDSGFAPSTKRVNLLTDTTIEVDFSMGVGNVRQWGDNANARSGSLICLTV